MKNKHYDFLLNTYVPGPKGPVTLAQNVADCTRCNGCAQNCPAYQKYPQEMYSPRGRVQTLRLLTERKLKIENCKPQLTNLINSCMLCAHCTQACAAQIPVAHYMLSLNKIVQAQKTPRSLYLLLWIYSVHTELFELWVRYFLGLRRIGLVGLLQFFLPAWIRHLHHLLDKKTRTFASLLWREKIDPTPARPTLLYLPSLCVSYADGQTGLAVCRLLKQKRVYILLGYSSGLAEYLYGQTVWTQRAAKRLLMRWEKAGGKRGIDLVTDSIEVYGFLKQYPLLFAKLPGWQKRAEKMAQHIKFIAEYPFPKNTEISRRKMALDTSSVLYAQTQITERARKILLTNSQKNLLECGYSRFPLPVAGLGLIRRKHAEELVHRHVQDIARKEIADVYCLSGWAALELNAVLKCLYPQAHAQHLVFAHREYGRTQEGAHPTVRRREA